MTEAIDDLSEYVAAWQNALIRTGYLLTGDYYDAEDLVQAALARGYLSWGGSVTRARPTRTYVAPWSTSTPAGGGGWRGREHVTSTLPDQPTVEPDHDDRDEL